jgi:hypothetical protein
VNKFLCNMLSAPFLYIALQCATPKDLPYLKFDETHPMPTQCRRAKTNIFNPDRAVAIAALVMGGQIVEHLPTSKYLGVLFSDKDDWDTHQICFTACVRTDFGAWYPKFT